MRFPKSAAPTSLYCRASQNLTRLFLFQYLLRTSFPSAQNPNRSNVSALTADGVAGRASGAAGTASRIGFVDHLSWDTFVSCRIPPRLHG